ncbi:unnamed protein product [Auanema sp. JU1783]|nr:unnamed protein product [Auanema sp. JU1783]
MRCADGIDLIELKHEFVLLKYHRCEKLFKKADELPVTLIYLLGTASGNPYKKLFDDLLWNYNKLVRPAQHANETIIIEFKLKMDMLVDVQERDQVLTANGWLLHRWHDYRLVWDPELYGGVRQFHIPGEMLWLPDIILYNNAHGSPCVVSITKVLVQYNGILIWEPPVKYMSFCNIDIEWYPYDVQLCELKFGSWTYSGTELDLRHPKTDEVEKIVENDELVWHVKRGVDISDYQESVEWDLLSVAGRRHEKWYPCCDYPSIDLTYYLQIRRKKLFYTVNLIVPCASLAALTSWVFYLPCESHQKIQLCISLLVSFTIFILLLIEIIPPTSIVIPLLVKYLTFTMVMVSLSVITTVTVQNIHFRTSSYPMSPWMRKIFIDWLGPKLLISRKTEQANYHRRAQHNKKLNALSAMVILERQFQKTIFEIEMATKAKKPLPTVNALFADFPLLARSKSMKTSLLKGLTSDRKSLRVRRQLSTDYASTAGDELPEKKTATEESVRDTLRRAERNVNYISQTLTERRTDQEAAEDWRFVSLVVDRILLYIFGITISVTSLVAALAAPSIFDTTPPISTR